MNSTELSEKLKSQSVVAAVIGLGYVGLPLLQHLWKAGYTALGFDIDPSKVEKISRGESYIKHIPSESIAEAVSAGKFSATADFSRLAEADCISICVPTPLNEHMEPDLECVRTTAETVATYLRPGQLVILESTTYPGTTTDVLQPILERSGMRAGVDFFLAYSPEREDPGNARFGISTIPKVVGGLTPACTELATDYYGRLFERIVPVGSPSLAEFSKLLENIFRSVNIALVNELKMLCDRMELDVWDVIDAASTKPFGFMPFYPGPGLGGHCIPIDPFYLSWKAREYGFSTKFIELAGQINTSMPEYVIDRLAMALNRARKAVNGSRVLVLGAAYKKDVDDMRESPSIKLIELLQERGAAVDYNDPYVPRMPRTRKSDLGLESVPLTAESLAGYDCVLIATDHSDYDYPFIAEHAVLIVDTRNAMRAVTVGREKIVKA